MHTTLSSFLSNYVELSPSEMEEVVSKFSTRTIKRNSWLLKAGMVSSDLVFVQSGCLRLYYLSGDIEISVWFAFPGSSAIEIHSFISGTPSQYYIQAIEDTEILFLPKVELNKLCEQQPKMQTMMKNFWEDAIVTLISRFTSLQTDSAEKRYVDLMNKPDYMSSIPQKFLASFIGVTPTSLSRIRKNIKKK